jgi:hypothetical protein
VGDIRNIHLTNQTIVYIGENLFEVFRTRDYFCFEAVKIMDKNAKIPDYFKKYHKDVVYKAILDGKIKPIYHRCDPHYDDMKKRSPHLFGLYPRK